MDVFTKLPRKITNIPFTSKHPEVEIPPPSSKHAPSSSSACMGSVCKSRTNSHLTTLPRTRRFPVGPSEGCSALPLCSGTSHEPRRGGRGLGDKCFICIPIYFSITHVAKWLWRAPLSMDELPRLGARSWSPSSGAALRSGQAQTSCRRISRHWKGQKNAFSLREKDLFAHENVTART